MIQQGVRFAEGTASGVDLSPSEQRALQAEKRAAWRQARLKSLEQVCHVSRSMSISRCMQVISYELVDKIIRV